jgi:phosphoadenosine phosphosulfate reductase
MDLQEKLVRSRRLLKELAQRFEPRNIAVAWTAGKDSTVALALWREVLADMGGRDRVLAVSLDTGFKFPEIVAFRDSLARQWDLDLRVLRPEAAQIPAVVAKDKLECCRVLKIEPLKRAVTGLGLEVLITGLRADENPSRQDLSETEARTSPDYIQANPILTWTEMDVWSHTLTAGLPYCGLYDQGYRSLGCVPCTVKTAPGQGERAGRAPEKEERMASLRALGYF